MHSTQPKKPVKGSHDFGHFIIAVSSVLALALFTIGWLGCDSSPLPPEVANVEVAIQNTANTSLVAEIADLDSAPVVEVKTETQEKGAPFPLDADTKAETTDTSNSGSAPVVPQDEETQPADDAPEAEPSMLQKAGNLFNKAKSKGAAAASGTGKWVQDKLGAAAETGEKTAEDTMKWANDTFNALKEQGLTTANDTSQWLSEDWKNMDSWEYHIETFGSEETSQKLEKMNLLGKIGWECFHIEGQHYYFKKPTHSYLRSLPFKDVIKLVPLMGAAGNNDK